MRPQRKYGSQLLSSAYTISIHLQIQKSKSYDISYKIKLILYKICIKKQPAEANLCRLLLRAACLLSQKRSIFFLVVAVIEVEASECLDCVGNHPRDHLVEVGLNTGAGNDDAVSLDAAPEGRVV